MATDALTEIANELYALPPADFTAARNARAKEARDADRDLAARITALRKPSPAAWVANALVRSHAAEVEAALTLGESMRRATEGLDSASLAQLSKQRRELVSVLVKQGAALAKAAGHPATTAVLDEVTQTLQAAMTDAAAADALRTGRLLRPLSTVGFEPVDLDGAVAGQLPTTRPELVAAPSARPEPAARKRDLQRAADEALQAATEAGAALVQVRERAAALEAARVALEQTLAEAEARARETREEIEAVRRDIRSIDGERKFAQRAAEVALRAAERARERATE